MAGNRRTLASWRQRRPESWIVRSLVVIFVLHATHFALRPMASYRALELGASTGQVGIVAGSYAALGLVLAMPVGRLADRIGETPLIIAGIALTAVVALSLAFIPNLFTLSVALALLGLAQLSAVVGIQTLFGSAGGAHGRDARYGALAVVGSAGHMVGPLIAGLLATDAGGTTIRLSVVFAGLASAATVVGFTLLARPPTHHERSRSEAPAGTAAEVSGLATFRAVLSIRSIPQAMMVAMTMMISIDLLIAYLPVYGVANGIPVATITTLLSLRAAAAVVSRLSLVPLLRMLGRKRLLLVATFGPALTVAALPLTTDPALLAALLIATGFGIGLGQPMTTSWIAGQVPVHIRGTAMGLRLTGNKLGQVALPGMFGAVAGATGIGAVFIALSALLATAGGLLATARLAEPGDSAAEGRSASR